jgi:serine/threonine-protein kinase RsbW
VVSEVDSGQITFGVIDEGKGYDDKKIPDPLAPENIGRQQGRGIFIVKHYADEFRLQGRGNCTVVRFLRNSPKTLKA